ncbi:MAG: type II toxin-antitoxin system VapC family toxin [Verrucomicrobia bacterium]|nr:type II toxin-antitoxin system VapC family toxin [Verrucomicrobiota bacterium]
MIYWDTSCVLKLYTAESDSSIWQDLAINAGEPLTASALIEAELAFAFFQKEARGDLVAGGAGKLIKAFRRDVTTGRVHLCPVGADVITRAADIAAACHRTRPITALRTLDGLHLATAALLHCTAIATTDHRLQTAAAILKMRVIGPSPDGG